MGQHDTRVETFDDGSPDVLVVPVVRRTSYSADLASSKSIDIPLAVGIDATGWTSGVLSVKYSARTFWPASALARVIVQNAAILPEEPQTTFVETSPALATSLWTQGTAGDKRLDTVAMSGAIGPELRVILRLSTALSAGIIGVTITVDLVGRKG